MPTENGVQSTSKNYVVLVDGVTGDTIGVLNLPASYLFAEMNKEFERRGLGNIVDMMLDELDQRAQHDARFNGGHKKDIATLRQYRQCCSGLGGAEMLQAASGQVPAPVSAPLPVPVPVVQPAPVQMLPSWPQIQQPQAPSTLSIADSLRNQQGEYQYRLWAAGVGEGLAQRKLLAMASNQQAFYPPDFEVVDTGNGDLALLASSSTRYVEGQLLTANFTLDGKVPKNRKHPGLRMGGDNNPFVRSVESPNLELQVGESVWVRILHMREGSKIRCWIHNESLGCDMEDRYLYFVITGGKVLQVPENIWRAHHAAA